MTVAKGPELTATHDDQVQISVEKTIERDGEEIDVEPSSEISYPPSSPTSPRDRGDALKVSIAGV